MEWSGRLRAAGVEVAGSGARVDPRREAGGWSEGGGGRRACVSKCALRKCVVSLLSFTCQKSAELHSTTLHCCPTIYLTVLVDWLTGRPVR